MLARRGVSADIAEGVYVHLEHMRVIFRRVASEGKGAVAHRLLDGSCRGKRVPTVVAEVVSVHLEHKKVRCEVQGSEMT